MRKKSFSLIFPSQAYKTRHFLWRCKKIYVQQKYHEKFAKYSLAGKKKKKFNADLQNYFCQISKITNLPVKERKEQIISCKLYQ